MAQITTTIRFVEGLMDTDDGFFYAIRPSIKEPKVKLSKEEINKIIEEVVQRSINKFKKTRRNK